MFIFLKPTPPSFQHYTIQPQKRQKYGYSIVSLGIEPDGIIFPSQNNNIVLFLFGILQAMWKLEHFSCARVDFDDPLRVLC
jgi:hypothetical protein